MLLASSVNIETNRDRFYSSYFVDQWQWLNADIPVVPKSLISCECFFFSNISLEYLKNKISGPERLTLVDYRVIISDLCDAIFFSISFRVDKSCITEQKNYPAQKKIVWETSLGQSLEKSLGVLEKSRIGSDPTLFHTIFPRFWRRLLSRLLVTNATILLYCMVITGPRTGS